MEKFVYLNSLYDLYGELLTEKQKKYFVSYYFDNLSYGEISEKYGVTRNAIYHQLKLIEEKLLFYEEKVDCIIGLYPYGYQLNNSSNCKGYRQGDQQQ